MAKSALRIGELLYYAGKITYEELNKGLKTQEGTNKKLGEVFVDMGYVTADEIVEVLEFQLGFPKVNLYRYKINTSVVSMLPERMVRKNKIVPIDKRDGRLVLAMVDPLNYIVINEIRNYTKMDIQPVIATYAEIMRVLDKYYGKEE